MGVKYVKDFTFDKGFGFTKSSAPVNRAAGGPMRNGADSLAKRDMDDIEQQNYDVLRRKGIADSRNEARSMATNPRGRLDGGPRTLEQLGDDAARPMDDTDKRRGGPVKRVAKKADGGAMDAPNYPPPALPGAPAVKPRAQVVPADSRGPSATDLAHHQGMVQGARLGARAATSHVLGALSRHAGGQQQQGQQPAPPMPAPAGQPGAPGMKRGGKFIQKAIKHPGRMKKGAAREGVSTHQYMEEHKNAPDGLGSAARMGLRLTGGDLKPKRKKD